MSLTTDHIEFELGANLPKHKTFTYNANCFFSLEQERVEYEAGKHVRESMQLVENAVLERDQVTDRLSGYY